MGLSRQDFVLLPLISFQRGNNIMVHSAKLYCDDTHQSRVSVPTWSIVSHVALELKLSQQHKASVMTAYQLQQKSSNCIAAEVTLRQPVCLQCRFTALLHLRRRFQAMGKHIPVRLVALLPTIQIISISRHFWGCV